jgi:hypothetical protein
LCALGQRDFTDRVSIFLLTFITSLDKLSHEVDSPDLHDLLWLKEVHSKIWNQKNLKPQLFREVELTYAHYVTLQHELKKEHSHRDLPNYNAREHNVRSAKLKFLRSITSVTSSQRHSDDDLNEDDSDEDDRNEEDLDEDDLEIKALFPYTLRYLDLLPLKLQNSVSARLPFPLLLRREYGHISRLVKKRPKNNGGSVIVSGQPGTGEFLVSLSYVV